MLKVNCGENQDCGCAKKAKRGALQFQEVQVNLSPSGVQRRTYEGRSFVVVPVIMAREGVVMNGTLTVGDELVPESWNGVPVTVGHPESEPGVFLSANAPDVLTKWHIGRIFNAVVEDGALRGEAWIEVDRANHVAPGLIKSLEGGQAMDVSTGYFCVEESVEGQSKGREFSAIARDIKPDHLALLPNEDGACSWKDGCGVRFNSKERALMKLKDKLVGAVRAILTAANATETPALKKKIESEVAKVIKANERGADDDSRQIVADLISNDASPFTPDDEDSLRMMSKDALTRMQKDYLTVKEEVTEEEEPEANEEEAEEEVVEEATNEEEEEPKKVANKSKPASRLNSADVAKIVAATVKSEMSKLLTNDDRAALARAKKATADHRATLIQTIVSNSSMKKKDIEAMDLATLEVVANGLPTVKANYGGVALPDHNEDDTVAADMVPPSTADFFANRVKARKEAH